MECRASVTMAEINRIFSPMVLYEENLGHYLIKATQHREQMLKEAYSSPIPFLIGSIKEVNEKISYLDLKLRKRSDRLIIESRESALGGHLGKNVTFTSEYPERERGTEVKPDSQVQVKDKKQLSKFSRRFTDHSVLMQNLESLPHIGVHSKKRADEDPKLVELQQFPGYAEGHPTALPNDVSLDKVIQNVILAQENIGRKPHYQAALLKLLKSPRLQAILLDTFWWFFLHRYQPDSSSQKKLFSRISENYTNFLIDCYTCQYRNAFLKEFPAVLCQAVYSSFCSAFPQSLQNFESSNFRFDICTILYEWIGGIRPGMNIHSQWNYNILEPLETRKASINMCKNESFFCLSELDAISSLKHPSFSSSMQNQSNISMTKVHKKVTKIDWQEKGSFTRAEMK
uniref:Family with sequence similarity 227 member A n=1 Tax=Latimeria chalumnae TaxID=7897 RepID=M3XIW5_LATCH